MPKRFMVWDKKHNVFLTQPLEIWQIVTHFCDRLDDLFNENGDSRYVFLQSTNLFDKAGKEIFESHILDNRYVAEFQNGRFVLKEKLQVAHSKYSHSRKGVITAIYRKQFERSRIKGWPMPNYSKEWLRDNFLSGEKFEMIYANWVKSGYNKMDKPSIDRIDYKLPYTKDNIQLMTWRENRNKENIEVKCRAYPVQVTKYKTGELVKVYESQHQAVVDLKLNQGLTSMVLHGQRNHTAGYKLEYVLSNPELLEKE